MGSSLQERTEAEELIHLRQLSFRVLLDYVEHGL